MPAEPLQGTQLQVYTPGRKPTLDGIGNEVPHVGNSEGLQQLAVGKRIYLFLLPDNITIYI